MKLKLASSNTLEGIQKLIAEYYYSRPERIGLIKQLSDKPVWVVKSGEKIVSPVVILQRNRYIFGVL